MMKRLLQRLLVVSAVALTAAVAFAQLGVVVAASTPKAASSALLLTSASASIKTCDFESRQALLADIDAWLKTAGEAVASLEREARPLAGEARENFQSALRDVKTQEDALKQNLRTAKKSTEDDWPNQRALVASSYTDYAGAIARLEAAASGRAIVR